MLLIMFRHIEDEAELLRAQRIPVLLYCLKSQVASLDFVLNRFLMNVFNASDVEIV